MLQNIRSTLLVICLLAYSVSTSAIIQCLNPEWNHANHPNTVWIGKKKEIAATAAHLYVYLYQIGKEQEECWPNFVKEFLDEYGIDFVDLRNDLQLKLSVRDIMSQYYGEKFKDRFWQTFVVEGPISLRRIRSLRRSNPKDNPFLASLFAEFMN